MFMINTTKVAQVAVGGSFENFIFRGVWAKRYSE